MSKKVIFSMILSVLIFGQIISSSMVAHASAVGTNFGIEYFVNHPEPLIGDNAGYITILCRYKPTGEKSIQTFFWTSYCFNSYGEELKHTVDLTVNKDFLKFGISAPNSATSAVYTVNNYNETGRFHQVARFSGAWEWRDSNWDILAYKCNGNVQILSSTIVNENNPFTVFFSTDGSSILLMDVISLLQSNNSIDSSIMNTVSGILNSVDGVENQLSSVISYLQSVDSKLSSISSQLQQIYNKADEILNEQKKSNTWLEKIFNFLEEKDEKDKEAATQQGSSSTSQGMDAIEDKGAGFANSLGTLTNSMSYNGTECAWSMPQIKLPAISGVMDEVVLLESQPIDFSQWVAVIPSNIMLVIQSVLTIGLIVYCFKELYNTIAYVLTLRKDDNS